MRILWIHFGLIDLERLASNSASARYRCLIPSQELRRQGIEVAFGKAQDIDPAALMPIYQPDAVLFTKLSSNDPDEVKSIGARSLALAHAALRGGALVISDHCDNRIDHPLLGSYYRHLIELCHGVVASTPELAQVITESTGKTVHVISDPVEGVRHSPQFTPPLLSYSRRFLRWFGRQHSSRSGPHQRPALLWFGHQSNFQALVDTWPALQDLARSTPLELHVLTAPTPSVAHFCDDWGRSSRADIIVKLTPWSEGALWSALSESDIVYLPCDRDPHKALAKSPNRLTEALWAGRFAVAHPIPAYRAFSEWAWIGENITSGIRWALKHQDAVLQRIGAAQSYIAAIHSPSKIAEQWVAALHEFRGR